MATAWMNNYPFACDTCGCVGTEDDGIEGIGDECPDLECSGTIVANVVTCAWFALCTNEAATTRHHPILGDVPICTRCDAKIEALS